MFSIDASEQLLGRIDRHSVWRVSAPREWKGLVGLTQHLRPRTRAGNLLDRLAAVVSAVQNRANGFLA